MNWKTSKDQFLTHTWHSILCQHDSVDGFTYNHIDDHQKLTFPLWFNLIK